MNIQDHEIYVKTFVDKSGDVFIRMSPEFLALEKPIKYTQKEEKQFNKFMEELHKKYYTYS